jgi:peptidoglycan/xylan/chitin deacetylase (PgdA/CDA1 family)
MIHRLSGWIGRTFLALRKGHVIRLVYEIDYAAGWLAGTLFEEEITKLRIKRVLKRAARPVFSLIRNGQQNHPMLRILTYHRIADLPGFPLCISPCFFEQQLDWLRNENRLLSFTEALQVMAGERRLDRDAVAITFDDGYADNGEEAFQLLRKYGVNAAFFLVTGRIGGIGEFGWVRKLGPPNYHILSWEKVCEMHQAGMIFGAHTTRHQRLSTLSEGESLAAIDESIEHLTVELGQPVELFAYPYGRRRDYGQREQEELRKQGIRYAFSARYGGILPGEINNPYSVPRTNIDPSDTLATFRDKVLGCYDFLGRW